MGEKMLLYLYWFITATDVTFSVSRTSYFEVFVQLSTYSRYHHICDNNGFLEHAGDRVEINVRPSPILRQIILI